MNAIFADTSYYLALLNPADVDHTRAVRIGRALQNQIVTTDFVLTEVGNTLSRVPVRPAFIRFMTDLCRDPGTIIIPATRGILEEGYDLFTQRPDKNWSLTDCVSFVVMDQHRLTEALTADHHFEQAGFTILLT